MKLFLLSIFITLLFSSEVSASEDRVIYPRDFTLTIDAIVSLDKRMKATTAPTILKNLFFQRDALTEKAKSIYLSLERQSSISATIDVSTRYRLLLQRYPLSCEIAALRMVIESITKRPTTEEKIMSTVPHSPSPMNRGVWGDPDQEFVGSYYGSQRLLTGYGVYEAPLSLYLSDIGISSEIFNAYKVNNITRGERLTEILTAIDNGDHVILWGDWCTLGEYEDGVVEKVDPYIIALFQIPGRNRCDRWPFERIHYWLTEEGKVVKGLSGEHAFLLLGYVGDRQNPTHIIVWDTDTGKHYYPLREWYRKWEVMDYRSLIIANKETLPEQK
jgi:uncharacterized protein YvpB